MPLNANHCLLFYYIIIYIVLYCIVLYCTLLHYNLLYYTLYFIILYYTNTVLYYSLYAGTYWPRHKCHVCSSTFAAYFCTQHPGQLLLRQTEWTVIYTVAFEKKL